MSYQIFRTPYYGEFCDEFMWQHFIACICNDNPTRVHLKINFTLLKTVCVFFLLPSLIFIFAKICSCCATHCCHSRKQQKKKRFCVRNILLQSTAAAYHCHPLELYSFFAERVARKCVKMSFGCMAAGYSSMNVNSHFPKQTQRKKKKCSWSTYVSANRPKKL